MFEDSTLAELLTTEKISELASLTLYLCYEKRLREASQIAPFIRELDRQRARGQQAVPSPLLWSEDDIESLLKGSPVVGQIRERQEALRKEYDELDTVWYMASALFNRYPFDPPTEAFSFEVMSGQGGGNGFTYSEGWNRARRIRGAATPSRPIPLRLIPEPLDLASVPSFALIALPRCPTCLLAPLTQVFRQAFCAVQASIVHLRGEGVEASQRFAIVPMGPPMLQYSVSSSPFRAIDLMTLPWKCPGIT